MVDRSTWTRQGLNFSHPTHAKTHRCAGVIPGSSPVMPVNPPAKPKSPTGSPSSAGERPSARAMATESPSEVSPPTSRLVRRQARLLFVVCVLGGEWNVSRSVTRRVRRPSINRRHHDPHPHTRTHMVATAAGMWTRPALRASTTALRYPSATLGPSTRVSTKLSSARASPGLVSTISSCVRGGPFTIMPSASSCSTSSSSSSSGGGGRPSAAASARRAARRAAVRCCCTRARCSARKMARGECGSGAAPLMRGRGRQGRQSLKQRSQGNWVCGVLGVRMMVSGARSRIPRGAAPSAHLAAALGLGVVTALLNRQ